MRVIHLNCPECKQKLSTTPDALQERMRCPRCAKDFLPLEVIPRDLTLPAIPAVGAGAVAAAPPAAAPAPKPMTPAGTVVMGPAKPVAAAAPVTAAVAAPVTATAAAPETATAAAPETVAETATAAAPETVAETATAAVTETVTEPATETAAAAEPVPEALAAPPPVALAVAPARAGRGREAALAILGEVADATAALRLSAAQKAGASFGFGVVAAGAAAPGLLGLLLLALTSGRVPRAIGGAIGIIALSLALAALFALLLLRWRGGGTAGAAGKLSREARAALAAGGLLSLALPVGLTWSVAAATRSADGAVVALSLPPAPPAPKVELPPEKRADHKLKREGHVLVGSGLLFVPPSFRSDDGAFDLLVHYHGNTQLVFESVGAAKVNALVYIHNLGTGSGPYEEKYAIPATFDDQLKKVEEAAAKRGLQGAKLRRLALSSWSAGYGAIGRLIASEKVLDRIDAVLVMDGLHVGFQDPKAKTGVDPLRIEPWVRLGRSALEGKRLFSLTHSEAETVDHASAAQTADALLMKLGASRAPVAATPPQVALTAAIGVVPKGSERWLEQTSEARQGELRVRGYRGNTPEHHMAHLIQMSVTVLPELAERWAR